MIGVALGVVGMVVLHVGIGIQKAGIAILAPQDPARPPARRRGLAVLVSGHLVTGVGMATNFIALTVGLPASTLSIFTGIGLVALVAFARLLLTEDVARAEAGALACILAGTVAGGIPVPPSGAIASAMGVLAVAAVLALATAGLAEVALARGRRELLQGIVAGVTGGIAINMQKEITALSFGPELVAPGAALGVAALGSAACLNLAFRRHRAVLLVPLGAACCMVTAVSFGVAAQGEGLGATRVVAVGLTVLGVAMMLRAGLRPRAAAAVPVA